ncbi:replication protein P [Pseudomonas pseudonitroreducens]|uniref:replication protein P n=1 Tax=Pseudomonas pseudonitroreducens TaxID=2892326 RepID=UPI001EED2BF8|nr:replication protein P [Pseudomonas pseudonitroreducens]
MNRAGQLATQIARRPPQPADAVIRSLDDEGRNAVETLVNKLFREIRGARSGWRQAWPNTEALDAAKVSWLKTFLENGISDWDNQVAYGMQRLRAEPSDWVPSPGKFATWCQPTPESLGLPLLEAAYSEALSKSHPAMAGEARWSHPAVYHAAARAGFRNLQALTRSDGLAALEEQYRRIRQQLVRGEELPPIPQAAITAQPHRTPEVGNAALAALRAKMKGARHV